MISKKVVDYLYDHWSRKLISLIILYLGVISSIVGLIYPYLLKIEPSKWSGRIYLFSIIVPYFICIVIYIFITLKRNQTTDVQHILDIFPSYATFARLIASLIIAFYAVFDPTLRALAIAYLIVIISVGSFSLSSLYYDISFRFARVVVDIIIASLIIYFYGNIFSPLVLLYFIPVTVSARYFSPAPSRVIALITVGLFFISSFSNLIDGQMVWAQIPNTALYHFITIGCIFILVGELIYAERRERIIPLNNIISQINEMCQSEESLNDVLKQILIIMNCEGIIALNSEGELASCYNKIGTYEIYFERALIDGGEYKKAYDYLDTLDISSVSSYWNILYSRRKEIVTESSELLKGIYNSNHLSIITSFIFSKLSNDKGYLIAINNKNSNKTVAKQFTPDRFEILQIISTVVDDHLFFMNN